MEALPDPLEIPFTEMQRFARKAENLALFEAEALINKDKVYIIDENSIINTLNIPLERKKVFLEMLKNPETALQAFLHFIESAQFWQFPIGDTDLNTNVSIRYKALNIPLQDKEILLRKWSTFCENYPKSKQGQSDFIEIASFANTPVKFLNKLGVFNQVVEKTRKWFSTFSARPFVEEDRANIQADANNFFVQPLAIVTSFVNKGITEQDFQQAFNSVFDEFKSFTSKVATFWTENVILNFAKDMEKRANDDEYKEYIKKIMIPLLDSDSFYRKSIVTFLSLLQEFPRKVYFASASQTGVSVKQDAVIMYFRKSREFQEKGNVSYFTIPTLSAVRDAIFGMLCPGIKDESFSYVTNHEFGHGTFTLLAPSLLQESDAFSSWKDIPFAKALLFPSFDFANQLSDPRFVAIINDMKFGYWDKAIEVLQIAGIFFWNDSIIINKLSDLDFAVSKVDPIRWTHAKTIDSGKPVLKGVNNTPDERYIRCLFQLHELDYDRYVAELSKKHNKK